MFPKKINNIVKDIKYKKDVIGRSEDEVYIFEEKYILKVSKNKNTLIDEKERVDFLNKCDIPCSKSICYLEEDEKCYYLRTFIKGYSLIDEKFLNNPDLLIDTLVKVIKTLRSLDNCDCPFKSKDNQGNDFVHGDLCLPNIYVDENNNFAGFIDLDNCGLGDKWYDYSWLLWSLEYNLKTNKYNKILLDKLNIIFDKEKYDQYIPEENQKKLTNIIKHEMKLNNGPYERIKSGTKTIELRLNDEKRQLLKIKDLIEFTNRSTKEKILVKIEDIYYYSSFKELYKHFDKEDIGYGKDEIADPKDMEKYYSVDEQHKYGVLGIKIKHIKD